MTPAPVERDLVVRDFAFEGGERLAELRLHAVTLGTPRRDASGRVANAVLLLHATAQTSAQFLAPAAAGELFGPGQPLDPARWYVIVPDGLGRGGSSKPSDGLRGSFPHYRYADVVKAQHLLVTEGLGVDRLRVVAGTSMGGMHAWMWAQRWPGLVDAILPIACEPAAIAGRNLLFRRILAEAIRGDPGFQGGGYAAPPARWLRTAPLWPMMLDSAARLQAEAPTRAAALALYDRWVEEARRSWDANDFLRWIESSEDYDPEPGLDRVRARVLAVNFADDVIDPPELGRAEALVAKVPGARFVLVPAGPGTMGHRTLQRVAVWKPYLAELLAALPP